MEHKHFIIIIIILLLLLLLLLLNILKKFQVTGCCAAGLTDGADCIFHLCFFKITHRSRVSSVFLMESYLYWG